jgi:hypothetical protein
MKSVSKWQIAGFIFTAIAGVLLHFLFDWSGGSIFAAPFSAVNESIWEHMKLLFFPMFIFAIIESRHGGKNFWCVKRLGIVVGTILIPVLYYVINGALGETPDWVNIAIFFITAATSYIIESYLFKNDILMCKSFQRAFVTLCIITFAFILFTFVPPRIPLFQDPVTGGYGFGLKGI